jgi:hypothetical protein
MAQVRPRSALRTYAERDYFDAESLFLEPPIQPSRRLSGRLTA